MTHQTRHHSKVSKTSASPRAGTSARQGGMARSIKLDDEALRVAGIDKQMRVCEVLPACRRCRPSPRS